MGDSYTYTNEVLPINEFQNIIITLAGPLINLFIAIIVILITTFGTMNVLLDRILYCNVSIFIFTIIPYTSNKMDSDGKAICKYIRNHYKKRCKDYKDIQ